MTLIDRLRTGTHEQAVGLLRECREIVKPQPTLQMNSPEYEAWCEFIATFNALLAIGTPEACVGAAMMLLDDGNEFEMTNLYNIARVTINMNCESGPQYGDNPCAVLSLALAAAIMEAHNG